MDLESLSVAAFVLDGSRDLARDCPSCSQPYFVSQYLASGSVAELLQRAEHYCLSLARALAIADHLAKFVPQSVKRLIEENPEAPELEKREQDVSVLFADISGYTRLSETLPQEQVNFTVERYLSSFWTISMPTRGTSTKPPVMGWRKGQCWLVLKPLGESQGSSLCESLGRDSSRTSQKRS